MKEPQILGEVMTPCFTSEADFEEGYNQSKFYVAKGYMEEYRNHLIAMQHVANIAKSYIYNNWKKVEDWSGLNVILTHGLTGNSAEYYNYEESDSKWFTTSGKVLSFFEDIDAENRRRHNPIISVDDVVLDPSDGDFSITVNGDQEYWWLDDESVIIIADFIEQKLNSK